MFSILLHTCTLDEIFVILPYDLPGIFDPLREYSEDFFLNELAASNLLGSCMLRFSGTQALLLAKRCFERAENLAQPLLANQPDLILSRLVLVWMMQKESLLWFGRLQRGLLAPSTSYMDV